MALSFGGLLLKLDGLCRFVFQISEEDVKKIEEENDELREKVKTLEDMVVSANGTCFFFFFFEVLLLFFDGLYRFVFQTSEQDSKKIREEENDELREKVKTLEEMVEVRTVCLESSLLHTKYVQLMEFAKSSFGRKRSILIFVFCLGV